MASDREPDRRVEAARLFIDRAHAALEAAEAARSDDLHATFYKEAETWLYMANKCLRPETEPPARLAPPPRRAAPERRSFRSDE